MRLTVKRIACLNTCMFDHCILLIYMLLLSVLRFHSLEASNKAYNSYIDESNEQKLVAYISSIK